MRVWTRQEVLDSLADGQWLVTAHGCVLDVSDLVGLKPSDARISIDPKQSQWLRDMAGHDISHTFSGCDEEGTLQALTRRHEVSMLPVPVLGEYSFVPAVEDTTRDKEWWRQKHRYVGTITARAWTVDIVNELTGLTQRLCVCDEDSMDEVVRKYLASFGRHGEQSLEQFEWFLGNSSLDMQVTIGENLRCLCGSDGGLDESVPVYQRALAADCEPDDFAPLLQLRLREMKD
ncbi:MAG: hypothetical protein MHM6MM_005388 [Cercozoa sp. M6MM]